MSYKKLIDWSQENFADLPWRKHRSLYTTLVSEIMLQQTTVSTVKNHFNKFISRYPNLSSLANASEEEMLIAWKGLGYYRRAKNLKKISEYLFTHHQGHFPDNYESLSKIPGIGPYTANAILSIGMDKKALALDANLERVISRLFGVNVIKGPKLQKEIQKLFNENLIFNFNLSFRELNEALMDLGRTYCQARKISCELCPLRQECYSYQNNSQLSLPVLTKTSSSIQSNQATKKYELHLLRMVVIENDEILVYKKNNNEWLAGQYEVPTFILSSEDESLKQYPVFHGELIHGDQLAEQLGDQIGEQFSFKTAITKYKITNHVSLLNHQSFKKLMKNKRLKNTILYEWKKLHSPKSNFSTATLKILKKM